MKWQLAIYRAKDACEDHFNGRHCWVRVGRPQTMFGTVVKSGKPVHVPSYYTNILDPDGGPNLIVAAEFVELLPEFKDEVDMVDWMVPKSAVLQ